MLSSQWSQWKPAAAAECQEDGTLLRIGQGCSWWDSVAEQERKKKKREMKKEDWVEEVEEVESLEIYDQT